MDDFGILARDFGYKPQGKSAPMKSATGDFRTRPPSSPSPFSDDRIFNDRSFTGSNPRSTPVTSDIDYDSIFNNSSSANSNTINNESRFKSTSSNLPVYDKPVYDDDIFEGLPGMKNKSMYSSAPTRFDDDIFASVNASPPKRSQHSKQSDGFDDLLGNLGRTEKVEPVKHKAGRNLGQQSDHFDDLFSGFGSGGPAASNRSDSESVPKSSNSTKATSNATDDPFVVLESTSTRTGSSQGAFIDPLKSIPKVSKSQSTNAGRSPVKSSMFDDLDPLHEFGKPAPAFSSENNNRKNDQSPSKGASSMGRSKSSTRREPTEKSSFIYPDSQSQNDFQDTQQPIFDMPPVNRATSPPSYTDSNSQAAMSPSSEENDIWLTVSEIPLFTQPTRAPPPSRPPPPIPRRSSKSERVHFASNTRTFENDSPNYAKYTQSSNPFQSPAKSHMASPLDEFENFAMGGSGTHENGENNAYGEEIDSNSAAAAMKDAMDRAEAKFRHAKEVREREHAKASRNKESVKPQNDETSTEEAKRQQREKEEREREREKIRLERERERQAVERATREARERAAAEAREKASAEARLKAERAAVQRAQAEARERAAIDAKERAERAAREARERASAEASEKAAAEAREKAAREKAAVAKAEADARRRAERAAVDKVAAEARERAAAEARDRAAAAAAAKINQQKNDNDLESFFSSRPSSAPRPRPTSEPAPDPLFQNRRGQEGPQRTSTAGASSNMRKASSTTNIVDDLSSIFGAAPSSAQEFQDIEGETEERRRARLERQQRTQERAAKALAEKNNRDLQTQREQEERNRISETLDVEIKRWAAGKEGNLRALLSTLQYVLWPGCGWQPVSLTDLITGANVKKAYRKATLCIHPDKVQQKGANLQQKYVAEKVFDLLKEAWNKFNSEELF
ncbi:putative DnaJ domain, Chaperone J-domain superfamily [Helianthus annuus]|uniref:DnaJ domain, Chaperone J-domain superfamily n=1 Tax=Helianthus annuus TaxID=4232 RepID=A0A251RY98_HELAN|nr:auxilin-related protein 2 [Helianthus annuus]KAF5759351.1 putative DnaJ domain, Chaperone J-domain superfamily [Helianthus annuus]KAJ0442061.1 putative DnaJ domain, Chaperone J-domain superfamily [Helianthus annuus]KAJ0820597.1 putative DnaJ domain, Chaperone J-domain superfamily [Helianthus annuus]KAJ0835203.1 putative DnaJ domain, Chaperone J-domain superfamily [Helianthus annuus]